MSVAPGQVAIPENEMNQFDLPRVCIVTGSGANVVFKPVKFQWYPPWIAIFVLCSPIIFAVVALIMMKRVKGELPFTEEAWSAWRRGKIVTTLAILGGVAIFFGGVVPLSNRLEWLGLLMMGVAIVGPIVIGVATLKGRGPRVVKIENGVTLLKLPSEQAAGLISSHLTAGAHAPRPPQGLPAPTVR